ncbi:probable GMP synthase [glutamine-hydrolyzing] [Mangifera indica]|uniref:probable GMP synthase [glutamine-hydrolyzing] n=1 Tax=Mangifera indica TaxID=29780 RepID=UPI001CFB3EB5|nr:probable GMP synthase [glutamine-hydrolyzing] [Mangifera indica]
MCSSNKANVATGIEATPAVAKINGRPVLQPACNRVPNLERRNSLKKLSTKSSPPPPQPPPLPTFASKICLTPPISPKSKSPRPPAIKRAGSDNNGLNSSSEKVVTTPRNTIKTLERMKSKSFKEGGLGLGNNNIEASLSYSSSLVVESPGSIAAVRREQMALQHAQRVMRIAHYGRSKSAKFEAKIVPIDDSNSTTTTKVTEEEKRCGFITPNSDPIYVAYHDEEWGVPVHDDNMLFELLVLSSAQVGSDWTSILKKRQDFRDAFSGFDAETVANLTDKQMMSISTQYAIDMSRVRGVVDNAIRILEIKKEFVSLDKYIWGFVNQKAINTQYKFGHKIPVKTSKSESISKDMVRRGLRFVGPTVVHSFMQAAGLTNDHLITCHRHFPCTLFAARRRPIINQEPTTDDHHQL